MISLHSQLLSDVQIRNEVEEQIAMDDKLCCNDAVSCLSDAPEEQSLTKHG